MKNLIGNTEQFVRHHSKAITTANDHCAQRHHFTQITKWQNLFFIIYCNSPNVISMVIMPEAGLLASHVLLYVRISEQNAAIWHTMDTRYIEAKHFPPLCHTSLGLNKFQRKKCHST